MVRALYGFIESFVNQAALRRRGYSVAADGSLGMMSMIPPDTLTLQLIAPFYAGGAADARRNH
jgi:hypothetical protein